jgi:hypothetical protein
VYTPYGVDVTSIRAITRKGEHTMRDSLIGCDICVLETFCDYVKIITDDETTAIDIANVVIEEHEDELLATGEAWDLFSHDEPSDNDVYMVLSDDERTVTVAMRKDYNAAVYIMNQ